MTLVLPRREVLRGTLATGALLALPAARDADPWAGAAAILARIRPPRFPGLTVSIARHGARPGGAVKNTEAIAAAIAEVAGRGGGRVLVPEGRWLTGAVHLRSNVELHLAEGATLLFSTDPADYPIVLTRFEGVEMMGLSPLVYAYRQRNVAVTGAGTLDGQGGAEHWWRWKGAWQGTVDAGWREGMPDQRAARTRLFGMAERGVPVAQRRFGAADLLRPSFVEPYGCENVLIEGVRLRGAPFWQLHPTLCRNVTVRHVDILGHGPNNDGCDPESCRDVLIEGVTFDTGDDCIAIKSGRNADGRRLAAPTVGVVVRDCTMREGHGGITIGSEISGGVSDVYGERCAMSSANLDYALRFKNNARRGGVLERLHFRDIEVGEVKRSVIQADFNYEEGAQGSYRPVLRDVTVERLHARRSGVAADLQGLPGAPVERVTLRDCRFDGVTQPSTVAHVEGLVLDRVRVNGAAVTTL